MNTMTINGFEAVVCYDPEVNLFRGEFVGLNGGADFYAKDVDALYQEGEASLNVFLESCQEEGIEPCKPYSGKLNLRIEPELHKAATIAAAASQRSLNQFIKDALNRSLN